MSTVTALSPEQRIFEAAKVLFTRYGFSNVSLRDICTRANASLPMVYYYYGNKKGLFEAVARKAITLSKFIKHLDKESKKAGAPSYEIKAFVRSYLSSFPREIVNVGLFIRNSTELEGASAKKLAGELDRVQSILEAIIRRGVATNEFGRTDVRMAAECLLGMMNRFIFQGIHFGRAYRLSKVAQYVSDMFLAAMAPPQSHGGG